MVGLEVASAHFDGPHENMRALVGSNVHFEINVIRVGEVAGIKVERVFQVSTCDVDAST